jgi:hypothetical protein
MEKLTTINYGKLIAYIILIIIIKEVIPDYLIQNPDSKSIYKIVFLGVLTVTTIAFAILKYRKNSFLGINNSAIFGLLSFWTFYSWIQYFGIFR